MTLKYKHLEGRAFIWGEQDCFALIRDFYADNFGIVLTNYARPIDWQAGRDDLITNLYAREGFESFNRPKWGEVRPGDLLAMAIGDRRPNHLGVYVGDNLVLHHLRGQLSKTELLRGFHRNSTLLLLRHPQVPDLRPVRQDVQMEDLLRGIYTLAPQEAATEASSDRQD